MKAPGALIRIPVTLVGDADPAEFEAVLETLAVSDPQIEIKRTPVRQRVILGGGSERHLEITVQRLIREHGFQVQLGNPEVAYLETILRTIDQDYTHKRQSGGTGQFARIKVRFEPLPAGTGYKFKNDVTNGSVPADFAPGVERGLELARQAEPITGSRVTDFQATLIDGAYHEVDSSAPTFEIAARACFKEGISQARPALLEPVMQLEVEMPVEATDGVISDLKTRRAMTLRTVDRDGNKLVTAFVPLANLFGYENDLRRLTKGRGSVHMSFERYERIILTSTLDPDGTHPGAAIGLRSA